MGYTVEEAPVTLEEALKADEVFISGTAVVLSPVGSLTHKGKKVQFCESGVPGELTYCTLSTCTAHAHRNFQMASAAHVHCLRCVVVKPAVWA